MQPAARLENWYTDEYASNEYEVYVKGEIYCNNEVSGYGLGSCCNGCLYQVVADAESSDVAEGSIILDWVSGATLILGKGATNRFSRSRARRSSQEGSSAAAGALRAASAAANGGRNAQEKTPARPRAQRL